MRQVEREYGGSGTNFSLWFFGKEDHGLKSVPLKTRAHVHFRPGEVKLASDT
jgi:hypothetical protein